MKIYFIVGILAMLLLTGCADGYVGVACHEQTPTEFCHNKGYTHGQYGDQSIAIGVTCGRVASAYCWGKTIQRTDGGWIPGDDFEDGVCYYFASVQVCEATE